MAQRDSDQAVYEYLVARPHAWRRQLYLRNRNITVGQLVATMRANQWNAEEAAAEQDLPLAQVLEALAYYEAHRSLVDEELWEEKRYLQMRGYAVDPPPLS